MIRPASWEQRIKRAEELAKTYPFAAELLHFYKHVAVFQQDLYSHVLTSCGAQVEKTRGGSLRAELDLFVLLPRFPLFLSLVRQVGPPALAQLAGELIEQGSNRWMNFLAAYWTGETSTEYLADDPRFFFARAFLQPYAEYLARHTEHSPAAVAPRVCPLCGGKPQVGVLRQEGDGAKRSLLCSLCLTEWEYRRIVCPACEEENVDKLAVYTASQFDHLRVEACDTCRTYINTVDLTKDGLAVPEVDELAGIPLALWAGEHGYKKLQSNLLGL